MPYQKQTLAEKHEGEVKKVVGGMLGRNHPLFEDAVQEALLVILVREPGYVHHSAPQERVWVRRIARGVAASLVKADARHDLVAQIAESLADDTVPEHALDPAVVAIEGYDAPTVGEQVAAFKSALKAARKTKGARIRKARERKNKEK